MLIRKACMDDAAQIQAIYAPYVKNTAITFEYDAPDETEMSRRMENIIRYLQIIKILIPPRVTAVCRCL